ncbi:MAG: cysteine desulfurase [bacterium]|nr:cysteine desulfurase [bacterium]
MQPVYLDYNASTPADPRVVDAMLPYLAEHFGNPSSSHPFGKITRDAVELARTQVATMLGCTADEIVFTSGGTESNNHAIRGVAHERRGRGRHIISSSVEHPAVTQVCEYLAGQGWEIDYLPVDETCLINPSDLKARIRSDTVLVTIMHANNEVGTIQPIAELARIAHEHGALFHTDCAQSVGKIPVRVEDLGVDLLSLAGHKIYAHKGVGALYVRRGTPVAKLLHGAGHEDNRRAGTENVLEIVGLGKACELIGDEIDVEINRLRQLRDLLEKTLRKSYPELALNGHRELRLPNTLSASFPGVNSSALLARLDSVALSAGAACHEAGVDVSAVLQAMHTPLDVAMGTLRMSVGRFSTRDEVLFAAQEILASVKTLP